MQDRYLDTLLNDARAGQGRENLPSILIVITARFQRISWKYAAIAYSLVLKHVGVLVQTMYLVASAMQIPCCAIGVGDSDLFAKATRSKLMRSLATRIKVESAGLGPTPYKPGMEFGDKKSGLRPLPEVPSGRVSASPLLHHSGVNLHNSHMKKAPDFSSLTSQSLILQAWCSSASAVAVV